jgi:transitional endoplasmic reticulum ATPase
MNAFIPQLSEHGASETHCFGRAILSPAQQKAFDQLAMFAEASCIVALNSAAGIGKSTVLKAFAQTYGGEIVRWDHYIDVVMRREIEASEESVLMAIEDALDRSDLVIIDGIEALISYPGRGGNMLRFQLEVLDRKVRDAGKRLIYSGGSNFLEFLSQDVGIYPRVEIEGLGAADYRTIIVNLLGNEPVAEIDFDQIYRHAPMLSGHDLRTICGLLIDRKILSAKDLEGALEKFVFQSNTHLEEVETLSFNDLPGTEHIVAKLETHVILPFENAELVRTLDLKAKRGVLLYGPPGTGKTSIGRALAHRMKGRFHLIDGSFMSEPPAHFFGRVRAIVQEAKENAPSVLFIDDADVLFGIEHIAGLSRYLLSLLDGLESESAGKVCVMMTAMNVSKIPSAVMRSGRVELWLETRAPDLETRAAILRKWLNGDLPGHDAIDYRAVAAEAAHFTPADLRRITGDARTFHAADVMAAKSLASAQAYLSRAIAELIATRERMAENLRDESLRIGTVRSEAKYGTGIGGLSEASTGCAVQGW